MRKRLTALLAVCLVAVVCACAQNAPPATEPLVIRTGAGEVAFNVEVARDPAQRERGLMYRQTLAPDAGMLFLFPREERLVFWMKNTYLPLDMIFIRSTGRIAAIVADTEPHSRERISPDVQAIAVLELNAGTAKRAGISVGDRVIHKAFHADGRP